MKRMEMKKRAPKKKKKKNHQKKEISYQKLQVGTN